MVGKCGEYDVIREGEETIVRIQCDECPFFPSLEDDPRVFSMVMKILLEVGVVTRLIFVQKREYEYPYEQVVLLTDFARKLKELVALRIGAGLLSSPEAERALGERYGLLQGLIQNSLKSDPLGSFLDLQSLIARDDELLKSGQAGVAKQYIERFVKVLKSLHHELSSLKFFQSAEPFLKGVLVGDRSPYRRLFSPIIRPDFMYTKLMASYPVDGEELDTYSFHGTDVTIFSIPNSVQYLYHVIPPEFTLTEEEYELLDGAKKILAEHQPKRSEFVDPKRIREVFYNVSMDLLDELSSYRNVKLSLKKKELLSNILVRYTVGFGLIEVLLGDEKIQDISINSPFGKNPMFIVHQDFGDCKTNVFPTVSESESWASKLRLISGRPLDEANPVMDTELELPYARARIAAVTSPLNPSGLAYSFRRHRDKPWTLPLFMKQGMINPLAAGLLSFLIDGSRTLLIAGTRSSGKSSLLGGLLVELMRRVRIITIEDTLELPAGALREMGYNIQSLKVASALSKGTTEVPADEGIRTTLRLGDSSLIVGEVRSSLRGSEEVIIIDNGVTKRIPIQDVKSLNYLQCQVPTIGFDLKTSMQPLTGFVQHPPRKKLLEVTTRTGRKVTVTPDHSLFTATKNLTIEPIECQYLKQGTPLIIPTYTPTGYNDIDEINLLDILSDMRVEQFEEPVRKAISVIGWKKATTLCNIEHGDIYNYFREHQKTNIPITSFVTLMKATGTEYQPQLLLIKTGTSTPLPAVLSINEDFCAFLGYYVSEGYCSTPPVGGASVIITNSNERVLEDITRMSKQLFNITPRRRTVYGAGQSVQLILACKPLSEFLLKIGAGRTCTEKRIPEILYGLSKKKIASFLRTLYEGDGSLSVSKSSGNSIRYHSTSKKLAEDVAYALLSFGIVARIYSPKMKPIGNKLWIVEFKERTMVEEFMKEIGFVYKNKPLLQRGWAHTKVNTVEFEKEMLQQHLKQYPRKYRHLFRFLRCSKSYLQKVVNDPACVVSEKLKTFAEGNFYVDEVVEVKEIVLSEPEPVYDLSVAPTQNFIGGFGGLLLHNTEALALYEAMRVGALANTVAGTIHGDSPYGVFDRVVNDLKVPRTSFKATDIIIVANPIRSPDGLHRWRRVTSITEVRKHWEQDPVAEGGFVDLMKYNAETDSLEPTPELLNGDSDILKAIGGTVKEWAGNWDAIWDNILLRS